MGELDGQPTLEELSGAIDSIACGKAKTSLQASLPVLGRGPQDMRDANIATLYKNKGDRNDCNDYRGISLLTIGGKIFVRVVLNRLQKLVYLDSRCGFRAGRFIMDMLFSLRQLQEKCREEKRSHHYMSPLVDLVSRKGLFTLLQKVGCPP